MSRLGRFYVKYVVKNYALFLAVLLLGVFLFVSLSLSVQLDNTEAFPGQKQGEWIRVETETPVDTSYLFLYTDRNEAVHRVGIERVQRQDNCTLLEISPADAEKLSAWPDGFTVELVTGRETLLYRILAKAGKAG